MHTVRARYIKGQVVLDADQPVPGNNCRVLVVFLEPGCNADSLPDEPAHHHAEHEDQAVLKHFSAREMDVLRCLCQGMTNKQIAKALDIKDGTVRNYTSRIFEKLKVHSRTEAAIRAAELGVKAG